MLPDKKSSKKTNFSNRKILMFGRPKIGKTSLVAALSDDIVFAAFERGHDDIQAYVQDIATWPQFEEFTKEVAASAKFKMMCIDTLDAAYIVFRQHFLTTKNIAHENDMPYGRGQAEMRTMFRDAFFNLQKSGKGFILIAHQAEELLGDTGKVIIRPNYPRDKENTIKNTISGMVDAIWWMSEKAVPDPKTGSVSNQRIIRCAGDMLVEAGTRFPMPDEVELVTGDVKASAAKLLVTYQKYNKAEVSDGTAK